MKWNVIIASEDTRSGLQPPASRSWCYYIIVVDKNIATRDHAERDKDTQCQWQAPNKNIRHHSKLKDLGPLCGVKLTLWAQPSPYLKWCNLLCLDAHDLSVSTFTWPLDEGIAACYKVSKVIMRCRINNDVKCDYYIRGHKIRATATSIKIMMLLHSSCRHRT